MKSKKSKRPIIIAAFITVVFIIGGIVAYMLLNIKSFDIVDDYAELKVDEAYTVSYTITPARAKDKKVKWSSSDNEVATVDSNGVVYGEGDGVCTITGEVGGKADRITVTVKTGPDLQLIYDTYCKPGWARVGSDGSYLTIDTNPDDKEDYTVYAAFQTIFKVNTELGLPESLENDMLSTTALMGRQTQNYNEQGISVSWSYHPDYGMEVTYKLIQ